MEEGETSKPAAAISEQTVHYSAGLIIMLIKLPAGLKQVM